MTSRTYGAGNVLDPRQRAGIVQILVHFVAKARHPNIPWSPRPKGRYRVKNSWRLQFPRLQIPIQPGSNWNFDQKNTQTSMKLRCGRMVDLDPMETPSNFGGIWLWHEVMLHFRALVINCWCPLHLLISSAPMTIHFPSLTGAYEKPQSWRRACECLNLDIFSEKS